MTRTRKSTQKNKNTNPFKQMVGMRSLARGSTRSNRRMKTAKNYAAWHNQIQNVLKQQHRESQLLGISGRAHSAFYGNAESTLPAHATKAERNAAIYQRLITDLASLEGRGHLSNANKKRMANLRHAVREYAPKLWLGGTRSKPQKPRKSVTFTNRHVKGSNLIRVAPNYLRVPEENVKVVLDPSVRMRNGASKAHAVRSLIMEALQKHKNAPNSVQKRNNKEILEAAAKIAMPTGVIGYGPSWRNVFPRNSTKENNGINGNNNDMTEPGAKNYYFSRGGATRRAQRGGGCGCSGGTPALFPSA